MIQSFPCRIYVLLILKKSWKTNLGGVPKNKMGVNFTSITGNRDIYFLPAWNFNSGELPVYGTTVSGPPTDKPRFACVSHSVSLNCFRLTLLPMAVTPCPFSVFQYIQKIMNLLVADMTSKDDVSADLKLLVYLIQRLRYINSKYISRKIRSLLTIFVLHFDYIDYLNKIQDLLEFILFPHILFFVPRMLFESK